MTVTRQQVAAARDLLDMTREDLAAAAGVSVRTIEKFEGGQSRPYPQTMVAILTALQRRGIVFSNGDKPCVCLDRSKAIIPTV